MGNLERRQELIQEVIKLIKEFRKEESIFGTDGLDYVKFNNQKQIFVIENFGYTQNFKLNELSKIFADEIDHGMIDEQVDIVLAEADIEELTKKDFIEFVGSAFYAQHKCIKIHERLKKIEKEFLELK